MSSTADGAPCTGWPRVALAFGAIWLLYQASEWLQTVRADPGPLGPALMLAALGLAWPLGRWLGWRGYEAYGLAWRRWVPAVLAGGLLLGLLAKSAALALSPAVGAADWVRPAAAAAPTAGALALALLSTFVPSVVEDILTRGFLLRTAPVRLTGLIFVLATAALYTLNHIWRFDWGMSEQVRLFCLGLAYGAAAWRLRSLWGAVALHWGWNLANALTGPLFESAGGSVDAARYLTAATHLVLLGIVLLLPRPRPT